jgi:MFS family permease
MQMTGGQSYLADISTPQNRARTIAPMAIAFQTGFAVGPSISGYLAEAYGIRVPFFVVGAAITAVALSNHLLLTETLRKSSEESKHKKYNVLGVWKDLLKDKDVLRISSLHALFWVSSSGSIFTLLPLLASEKLGLGVGSIGALFTMFAIVGVIGAQPSAWMSDKYGRRKVILPAMAIMSTALALMPFVNTPEQLYAVAGVWAVGSSILGSSPTAYLSDLVAPEQRGQALGLLRSAGDLGLMIGAGTLGAIAHWVSMPAAFYFNSTLLAGITVNFALRARETSGPQASES